MTLGVGAAMLGGTAIAAADTGSTDGSSNSSSSTSSHSSSDAGSSAGSASGSSSSESNSTATQPSSNAGSSSTPSSSTSTSGTDEPTSTATPTTSSPSQSTNTTTTNTATTNGPSTTVSAQTTTGTFHTGTGDSDVAPAKDDPKKDTVSAEPVKNVTSTEPVKNVISVDPVKSTAPTADSPAPVDKTTSAKTAAPTVAAAQAVTALKPPGLPTPSQIIAAIQGFGANLYLTAMNQVYGFQRNLDVLRDDVANVFGIRRVVITKPLPFGTPASTVQYYVSTNDYYSAALATVAMAYGQLTGTAPDLQGIIDQALTTDSFVYNGEKIYLGEGSTKFVTWVDSFELLQDKNVRVITRYYGNDQWSKAFNDLTNGLQNPTKAMIVPISGLVDGRTGENPKTVVVIGVDNVNGTVTVNDPTRADGQGLTMSIDDFKEAWGAKNYQLVTTQLASSPSTPPPAPSSTKLVWSLPRPDQIGSALQSAFGGIAAAFVHQIDGIRDNFADLSTDLARTFGVAGPVDVTPPAPEDIQYGDYAKNFQYWAYQGDYATCALMATAAVIAQLTGNGMPVDMNALGQAVIDLAETTVSGVRPGGVPMFKEPSGTYSQDVVTLLNMYDLNADYVTYLKNDGNQALVGLTTALSQGQGVIVSVHNNTIYNAYVNTYFSEYTRGALLFPNKTEPVSNHAVVVLGVDLTKNVVYLNDSAWQKGQGLPIPLDTFMKAWQYSGYGTVTAEKRTV